MCEHEDGRAVDRMPATPSVGDVVRPSPEDKPAARSRFRLPTLTAKIGMVPMEPASLVMERKMLHGIKRRAERLATDEKETRA